MIAKRTSLTRYLLVPTLAATLAVSPAIALAADNAQTTTQSTVEQFPAATSLQLVTCKVGSGTYKAGDKIDLDIWVEGPEGRQMGHPRFQLAENIPAPKPPVSDPEYSPDALHISTTSAATSSSFSFPITHTSSSDGTSSQSIRITGQTEPGEYVLVCVSAYDHNEEFCFWDEDYALTHAIELDNHNVAVAGLSDQHFTVEATADPHPAQLVSYRVASGAYKPGDTVGIDIEVADEDGVEHCYPDFELVVEQHDAEQQEGSSTTNSSANYARVSVPVTWTHSSDGTSSQAIVVDARMTPGEYELVCIETEDALGFVTRFWDKDHAEREGVVLDDHNIAVDGMSAQRFAVEEVEDPHPAQLVICKVTPGTYRAGDRVNLDIRIKDEDGVRMRLPHFELVKEEADPDVSDDTSTAGNSTSPVTSTTSTSTHATTGGTTTTASNGTRTSSTTTTRDGLSITTTTDSAGNDSQYVSVTEQTQPGEYQLVCIETGDELGYQTEFWDAAYAEAHPDMVGEATRYNTIVMVDDLSEQRFTVTDEPASVQKPTTPASGGQSSKPGEKSDGSSESGDSSPSTSGSDQPATPTYKIIKGDKATYLAGSSAGLSITFDGPFAKFTSLSVDGKALSKGTDYMVEEGSTVVTLTPTYLATLATGTHKAVACWSDGGTANATFTITAQNEAHNAGSASVDATKTPTKAKAADTTTRSTTPKTDDVSLAPTTMLLGGVLITALGTRLRHS